jgi:hypothetical protein
MRKSTVTLILFFAFVSAGLCSTPQDVLPKEAREAGSVVIEPAFAESTLPLNIIHVVTDGEARIIWWRVVLAAIQGAVECCISGECCTSGIIDSSGGTTDGVIVVTASLVKSDEFRDQGASYNAADGKLVLSKDMEFIQSDFRQKIYLPKGTYYARDGQQVRVKFMVR